MIAPIWLLRRLGRKPRPARRFPGGFLVAVRPKPGRLDPEQTAVQIKRYTVTTP